MLDNLVVALVFAAIGSVAGYYFCWFRFGMTLAQTKKCPVCKAFVDMIKELK